mgnify:CR=1 FL=1
MKKVSLVVLGLAMVTSASLSANAIELKTPGLTAVKTPATVQSTKTDKNAANEKYQKEYHAKIKEQQAALNAVKAQDKAARLALADVILPKEKVNEIKALTGEEFDNALNTELVSTLSAETFIQDYADFSETKKAAYYNAVKEIQAVDNRYKNVSNQLTAPLKAIVDGDVSAISSKDELKNAGAMILGIKKNLGTSSDVKKAINKVNKMNNITVVVDDKDRVVYPENGVVGSINSSLEEINNTVAKANLVLGGTLYTQEQQKTLAAIKNNKDLSEEEKSKELKAKAKEFFESNQADGTTKKLYESLSAADKEKFNNAAADVIGAVASYGALGMQCTKLGFNISKNPLLAAPLAFELGALKDTAGLIKDSSSSLAKSVSQLKKVMKDNGITVTNTASAQNTGVKATGLKNLKPVSLKK